MADPGLINWGGGGGGEGGGRGGTGEERGERGREREGVSHIMSCSIRIVHGVATYG